MIHSLWEGKGTLRGNRAWKKVIRGWKPSRLLPPAQACFQLPVFISQVCRQHLCEPPGTWSGTARHAMPGPLSLLLLGDTAHFLCYKPLWLLHQL